MYTVITKDEEEVTVSVCTRCALNWENQNFAVQFLGRGTSIEKNASVLLPTGKSVGILF